jgi:hypothetical protein
VQNGCEVWPGCERRGAAGRRQQDYFEHIITDEEMIKLIEDSCHLKGE